MNFKKILFTLLLACSLTSLKAMGDETSESGNEWNIFDNLPSQPQEHLERIVHKDIMFSRAVPLLRILTACSISVDVDEKTKNSAHKGLRYACTNKPEATRAAIHQFIDNREFLLLSPFISAGADFEKRQRREKYTPKKELEALVGTRNIKGYDSNCRGRWSALIFGQTEECTVLRGYLEELEKRKEK